MLEALEQSYTHAVTGESMSALRKMARQGIRNYILILNHGFTLESFRRGFKSTDTCDLIPGILILRFWNRPLV